LIKYEKFLKNKIIVVENKLLPNIEATINDYRINNHVMTLPSSKIKIGLIGSLMFKESLKKIRDFIIKNKNFELHIYGDGLYGMFNDIENVFYHGRFKSPEDLSDIYSNIDINVILYDTTNNNVKLALPNKLYESIAFLKPIICSDNVALSEIVVRDGIGEIAINDDLASAIYKIISNYDFYIHNMKLLDSSRYICFEQSEIFELINRAE
jgi:glycosyltransferase involved in cell wall biosynthesis